MRRSPVSAGGGLGATGLRGCGSGSPGSGSKGLGRGCARLQADGEALPHELAAGLGPFQPLAETSIALRRAVSLESPRHGRWPPCRQGAGGENAPENPPGGSHSSHNSAWKEQPMAPVASSALCLLEASHPPEPLPRGQESHKDMIPEAQDGWARLRGCPGSPGRDREGTVLRTAAGRVGAGQPGG